MCCKQDSIWLQNVIGNVIFPITVAIITYLLFRKLDEWKRRRSYSKLGIVILESLIEEVKRGLEMIKAPEANSLPRKSWYGMTTIPDEVLLRIIEVSKKITPISFNLREIRIHTKNYFEHMCLNWDKEVVSAGQTGLLNATQQFFNYPKQIQDIIDMLNQTKDLLDENSTKWFPK